MIARELDLEICFAITVYIAFNKSRVVLNVPVQFACAICKCTISIVCSQMEGVVATRCANGVN